MDRNRERFVQREKIVETIVEIRKRNENPVEQVPWPSSWKTNAASDSEHKPISVKYQTAS